MTTEQEVLKMKKLKEKVIDRLIKGGFNIETITRAVSNHFEYAAPIYKTPKHIADCIMTIH